MVRDLHTYVCGSNGLMERVKAMELMLSELQGFKYRVIGIAIGVSTVVSLGWQLLKK